METVQVIPECRTTTNHVDLNLQSYTIQSMRDRKTWTDTISIIAASFSGAIGRTRFQATQEKHTSGESCNDTRN